LALHFIHEKHSSAGTRSNVFGVVVAGVPVVGPIVVVVIISQQQAGRFIPSYLMSKYLKSKPSLQSRSGPKSRRFLLDGKGSPLKNSHFGAKNPNFN
jgi:hypothetical protein